MCPWKMVISHWSWGRPHRIPLAGQRGAPGDGVVLRDSEDQLQAGVRLRGSPKRAAAWFLLGKILPKMGYEWENIWDNNGIILIGCWDRYGGFLKWRYPNSWMVYFMEIMENPDSVNGWWLGVALWKWTPPDVTHVWSTFRMHSKNVAIPTTTCCSKSFW